MTVSTKRSYVSGFLIDADTNRVVLIRKNRPAWQAGRLNAVGGKIESPCDLPGRGHALHDYYGPCPQESPLDAMRREFLEETGVFVPTWEHIATCHDFTGAVHYFRCFDDYGVVDMVSSVTDEAIEVHSTETLIPDLMPVITWLLPLALYRHGDFDPVVYTERDNILSHTGGTP